MDKIAIKYDRKLTKAAKSIFGNIVEKAYYTTWDHGHHSKSEIRERLKDLKGGNKGGINIGGKFIWIKFTNGKMVEFSSSECGIMCQADIKKSYEVE